MKSSAKLAVSGANFAIAETGGLLVAESEGNGRTRLTLSDTLILVVGIEKLVPTWRGLHTAAMPPDPAPNNSSLATPRALNSHSVGPGSSFYSVAPTS